MRKKSRGLTWIALGLGFGLGYLAASPSLQLTGWGSGAAPAALSGGDLLAGRQTRPAQAEQPATPPAGKPNIVFLMADNLGYGELGCYGGGILRGAPTPRIDRLAGEGLRLLNYNVEAQCTPSRSALLTGRF